MSVLRKTPREVYRVYAEDDCLADVALSPGDCAVRRIDAGTYATDGDAYEGDDAHASDSPAHVPKAAVPGGHYERPCGLTVASLVGLVLLIAVTLGAAAVVVLHASHSPAVRQSGTARHVFSSTVRRVSPDVPVPAPPRVHGPYTQSPARAATPLAAHPLRHGRPLARGHEETQKTIAIYRPAPVDLAGGEFDFER